MYTFRKHTAEKKCKYGKDENNHDITIYQIDGLVQGRRDSCALVFLYEPI